MTGNSLRLAGKILVLVKLIALTIYAKVGLLRPRPRTNINGKIAHGLVKYTGVGKICNFRRKSPIISETVRDRPMVVVER